MWRSTDQGNKEEHAPLFQAESTGYSIYLVINLYIENIIFQGTNLQLVLVL